MNIEFTLFAFALTCLVYVFTNVILSKEILLWEPSKYKQLLLLLTVWLFPFVGAAMAYKHLNLEWFKDRKQKISSASTNLSAGLLEIDAIFNPGQRHVVEQKQKEHIELKEDIAASKKDEY